MEAKNIRIANELKKRIEMGNFEEIVNILKLYESAKKVPAINVNDIRYEDKSYSISFPGSATHDFQLTCSDGRVLLIDVIHDRYRFKNHISVYVRFLLPRENFELDFNGLVDSVPLDSEDCDNLSEINGKRLVSALTPSYLDTRKCVDDAIQLDWNLIPNSLDESLTDEKIFEIGNLTRRLFKETVFSKLELDILTEVLEKEIKRGNNKARSRVRDFASETNQNK